MRWSNVLRGTNPPPMVRNFPSWYEKSPMWYELYHLICPNTNRAEIVRFQPVFYIPSAFSIMLVLSCLLSASRWAPLAGRDFFLQSEIENASFVVYVSDSVKTDKNLTDSVTIASNEYTIIGSTIIVDQIIQTCLPSSKVHDLIPDSHSAGLNFRNYYIMPYTTYRKAGFSPDFVIIRMDGEETGTIKKLADALYTDFPGIEGTYPKLNTDDTQNGIRVYFGVYGIILCVAAWTGAVGILVLWIKSQLRNFWIFISCGLTRVRNILWLGSEILIITAFGKILSLLSYYLLEDFWKSFNVSPAGFGISPVLSFLTLFLASILIAAITSLRLEKSIHNYE